MNVKTVLNTCFMVKLVAPALIVLFILYLLN